MNEAASTSRVYGSVYPCSAQGERLKIGVRSVGSFVIIRKRRGGGGKKKREFSNDIRNPFSPLPFRLIFCGLRFFFSFSFSRAIYQFFFLFLFTKNASVVVHTILRVSWKLLLPLLFPFLHESLWKLKGCLGGTRKRVTLITDRLFSGPKAGRKLVISDPLLYKRDD